MAMTVRWTRARANTLELIHAALTASKEGCVRRQGLYRPGRNAAIQPEFVLQRLRYGGASGDDDPIGYDRSSEYCASRRHK